MKSLLPGPVKLHDVEITKTQYKGKWIVRVKGVTSGFIVHTETDDSTIEFSFDASRFEPFIQIK